MPRIKPTTGVPLCPHTRPSTGTAKNLNRPRVTDHPGWAKWIKHYKDVAGYLSQHPGKCGKALNDPGSVLYYRTTSRNSPFTWRFAPLAPAASTILKVFSSYQEWEEARREFYRGDR